MPQRSVHVLEINDRYVIDSGVNVPPVQCQVNESSMVNTRKQLSEILRPILTAMKLTGHFFGPTAVTDDNKQSTWNPSRFYSALVILSQHMLIVFAVISHCHIGLKDISRFIFLLQVVVWYLQCASGATICSIMMPLSKNKRSKFSLFLSSFVETEPELKGIKAKAVKGLIFACSAAVANTVIIGLFSMYSGGMISAFPPWQQFAHKFVRVAEVVMPFFYSFAMVLPVLMFCVTCMLLEKMFSTLENKLENESIHNFTISYLRKEHVKLCEIVDLASAVFSPLLCVIITLDATLICVNSYQLTRGEASRIAIIAFVYWTLFVISLLLILFSFGDKVHEKVSVFLAYLHLRKNVSIERNKLLF